MKKFFVLMLALVMISGVCYSAEITKNGVDQGDLVTYLENVLTMCNEIKSDYNTLRTALISGSGAKSAAGLTAGTTPTAVASDLFYYRINGVNYSTAAVAAGTALSATSFVPANKYGLWRYEVGVDGTIDCGAAAANSTGYTTEALAISAIPSDSSAHIKLGYVTVVGTSGFTAGTTSLTDSSVTATYYDADVASSAVSTTDLTLTIP